MPFLFTRDEVGKQNKIWSTHSFRQEGGLVVIELVVVVVVVISSVSNS